MPPTRKSKTVTKGKGKGKTTVTPKDPDRTKDGGLKIKMDFSKKRRRVLFDRLLIFDIGMKISLAKDYNPIREVWIIFTFKSKPNIKGPFFIRFILTMSLTS